MPLEMAWVQVAREAGGRARHNVPIGRVGVSNIHPDDQRRLDGVVSGLPIYQGLPLVLDATIRSPLTSQGVPIPRADVENGATFVKARADKRQAYPELFASDRCRFITCTTETGGRFCSESVNLVRALVAHRSERAPRMLRKSTQAAISRRFWSLLSVAAIKGIAQSLEPFVGEADYSGAIWVTPSHEEIFAGFEDAPEISRMA